MTSFARQERATLADLLEATGPAAPTLCEGWDTRDMAAHLVIRERRPDAAPGIVFKPLATYMEHVRVDTRDSHEYADLLATFRKGPPLWSPIRLPALDEATNAVEYFIHAEDVRRAAGDWSPRELPEDFERMLWGRLRRGAKVMLRHTPVGLTLENLDGDSVVVKKAEPHVTLRGKPSELTLVSFGRGDHAQIETLGAPEDVQALLDTKFGI